MRAKAFIWLVHGSPPMGVMVQQNLSKSAICCSGPRLASIVQVKSRASLPKFLLPSIQPLLRGTTASSDTAPG